MAARALEWTANRRPGREGQIRRELVVAELATVWQLFIDRTVSLLD